MWTKLRSVKYDGISPKLTDEDVDVLSEVEHVRWNTEQLLMGYAPLKKIEQLGLINKREEAQKTPVPVSLLDGQTTIETKTYNED